ncbi:hypothetical protein GJ634_06455 [Halobacterium sp. CBA1126]|nr:hypothetical protein [Halobacterium sp. CBA1126]
MVRYGFTQDDGSQKQELKLRSVYEPIPENATTSSAIYFVTDDQLGRLENLADNPYRVEGDGNIVKEIQDECEDSDRVRYPVYAESDARDDGVPFDPMIAWIQGFIEEELNIPSAECTFWYSGSRSIHVHAPRFLTHTQLTELRRRAKQYCEKSDAELDAAIYKAKQQFRLPGVTHRKSAGALQKVQIDPSWQNDTIIRTSSNDHSRPDSYLGMLEATFTPQADGDDFALTLDAPTENEIETPVIEKTKDSVAIADVPEWEMHRGPQFSPYALATGNPRSVAALEVKGGAFAREGKRGGAPMVPARFFGAVGCDGHYTKNAEHAPLQLSEGAGKDYEKWVDHGFEARDYVVIIGGRSRCSIIHSVSKAEALQTGYHLIREDGGRQAALTYLSDEGYSVGSSGSTSSSDDEDSSRAESIEGEAPTIYSARENPQTDAEALQQTAEQDGIGNLSYWEIRRVAHRLLRYGWEPSWEWFEEQYGSEFDPVVTWTQFRSIVEENRYHKYDDVEVPEKPT